MSKKYEVGEIVEIGGDNYVVVKNLTGMGCSSCDLMSSNNGYSNCKHPDIGDIGCGNPSVTFKKVIEVDTPNIIQFIRPNKEGEYTLDMDTHIITYSGKGNDYTRTTSGEEIEFKFDIGEWVRVDECSSTDTEEATPVDQSDYFESEYWKEYFENYEDVERVVYHDPKTTVVLLGGYRATTVCNEVNYDHEKGFLYAYRGAKIKQVRSLERELYIMEFNEIDF